MDLLRRELRVKILSYASSMDDRIKRRSIGRLRTSLCLKFEREERAGPYHVMLATAGPLTISVHTCLAIAHTTVTYSFGGVVRSTSPRSFLRSGDTGKLTIPGPRTHGSRARHTIPSTAGSRSRREADRAPAEAGADRARGSVVVDPHDILLGVLVLVDHRRLTQVELADVGDLVLEHERVVLGEV